MSIRVWGFALVCVAGCDVETSFQPLDLDLNRMINVPRADPYERSSAFEDGKTLQNPPEHTVARGEAGERPDKPPPLTRQLLARGQTAFDQTCAACHGADGESHTVVAQRMSLRRPPALSSARVRQLSPNELYTIVTQGYGLMPPYSAALSTTERWAVVAYVNALWRTRTTVSRLPAGLASRAKATLP